MKFKYELGQSESSNNYQAVNPSGALGRYQFMPATLNSLQTIYSLPAWIGKEHFLTSPSLQDLYFEKHLDDLMNYIRNNNLDNYYGVPVVGTMKYKGLQSTFNEAGMLAAMHLAGTGNVKKYFQSGYNPNDGMTSLTDYAAYFSDKFKKTQAFAGMIPLEDSLLTGIAFMLAIVLYYTQHK